MDLAASTRLPGAVWRVAKVPANARDDDRQPTAGRTISEQLTGVSYPKAN